MEIVTEVTPPPEKCVRFYGNIVTVTVCVGIQKSWNDPKLAYHEFSDSHRILTTYITVNDKIGISGFIWNLYL